MADVGGITGDSPYIKLGDLEYSSLRQSLRDYLAGAVNPVTNEAYFSDYDLEGSALSTLLDLLTYNSTLYGFYANMIANESFLDTAQTEEAVFSLVKPLGYIPASRRGARAQITVQTNASTSYELGPGDLFVGGGLKWTPTQIYTVPASGDISVEIFQGQYQDLFVDSIRGSVPHQKFEVPSNTIDTSTLEVYVDEGEGQVLWEDVRTIDGNITGIDETTKCYFLTTSTNGRYAIYFGDGYVGKKPTDGSQVYTRFYETAGNAGNGVVNFTSNTGSIRVVGTEVASGAGSNEEDIESVRTNAPLFYQTQGRYVTAQDHRVGLLQEESGLVANVWGGEENDPPNYGRVYVSALGGDGSSITENGKRRLTSLMRDKGVVTILPDFVEPNPIDLSLRGNVFFDPTRTGTDQISLESVVRSYINNFLDRDFNTSFNFPTFSLGLTRLDDGIIGETLSVYLEKTIEYDGTPIQALSIPFRNSLASTGGLPGTVIQTPTPFLRTNTDGDVQLVYMIDDGFGGIKLYDDANGAIIETIGSVNYQTGSLQIDGLGAIETFIIEARPRTNTILSSGQNLLTTKDGGVDLVTVT